MTLELLPLTGPARHTRAHSDTLLSCEKLGWDLQVRGPDKVHCGRLTLT